MQSRTRVAVFLLVASVVAAGLATCSHDAAPPEDPATTAMTGTTGPTGEAVPRERPPRRRVARTPAPADPAPPDREDGSVVVDAGSLGTRVWTSPVLTATASAPAETGPTGRVRVLMLKDGRPFEGGHICFFPEELFVEPGPWDGVSSSDYAYAGLPMYTAMWPHFDPVLGSGGSVPTFDRVRGVTGPDGVVSLDVAADRALVLFVRYAMSGIPLVSQPRVNVAAGGEITLTVEAARVRTVTGRCVDAAGAPLPGIVVQAISPLEERPLSRTAVTSATGAFELSVIGDDPQVRVRAVVNYGAQPLGIYYSEADVPPIPAETTVAGVVPDGGPLEVKMQPAPLVFIELIVAERESPLLHLQIEGLVFDRRAAAWGRLGGPQYRRGRGTPAGRRAVIALPRSDAVRPLMLWSWGWTITAVDPRGSDRVSVEMPRGRWAGVRGRGWKDGDRLRVVAFCGPEGDEMPCIWIDDVVGATDRWSRGDSPVAAIEFQLVRDDVVIGRSARVPPGTGAATEVSLDVE